MRARVIPVLLLDNGDLVKTVQFKNPNYIGDPINAIRLYNDMEVDEIIVLDISASRDIRPPSFELIHEMASECFMPMCYGGGIKTLDEMRKVFRLGVEKVSVNTSVMDDSEFLRSAAKEFGSQSVVASIDIKKGMTGKYRIYDHVARKATKQSVSDYIARIVSGGAGEILINSVDRDGSMKGFDLNLITESQLGLSIPLVACGGAGELSHLRDAIQAGASAVAAGSLFVYQSQQKGILINYPTQDDLKAIFL